MNKPANQTELIAELKKLPALTKKHFSWPFRFDWVRNPANKDLIKEVIRINGSAGITADWVAPDVTDILCGYMKELGPKYTLSISSSPWHRVFGLVSKDPKVWNKAAVDDMELQRANWERVQKEINGRVTVDCIMLDQELFHVDPGDSVAMFHLKMKNDISLLLANQYFPSVRILQYDRLKRGVYYSGDEKGVYVGTSLYYENELAHNYRVMSEANALTNNELPFVVPCVSLGWSYARHTVGNRWDGALKPITKIPFGKSFTLGWNIHNSWFWDKPDFADFSKSPMIFFWPACFDLTQSPDYGLHYLAYVWGSGNGGQAPTDAWLEDMT